MDADHIPDRHLVTYALSLMKAKNVKVLIGYQKHDLGDYGPFGKYYRIIHASSIFSLMARDELGLAPIFTGSVGVFEYEWLKNNRFDDKSITEDWELSLRSYINGSFSHHVTNKVFSHCAVPQDIKWFIRHQIRWAEGTIADFKRHFVSLIKAEKLSVKEKIGLIYQDLLYSQSLVILISFVLSLIFYKVSTMHTISFISAPVIILSLISWLGLFIRGLEIENMKLDISVLVFSFLMIYIMSLFYSYGTVKGLILKKRSWIVTRRRS